MNDVAFLFQKRDVIVLKGRIQYAEPDQMGYTIFFHKQMLCKRNLNSNFWTKSDKKIFL